MNWKCHHCGHQQQVEPVKAAAHYPCGPCQTCCPKCDESCCPSCGDEMGRCPDGEDPEGELMQYTLGACENRECSYTCCGGCI